MNAPARLAVLAAVTLAAAGSAGKMGGVYRPTVSTAEPGVTDDDIYAATIRILADDGYDFEEKDKDAGIVRTRPVEVDRILMTAVLHAWRARIEEGTLRLEIGCGTFDTRTGERSPGCGEHRNEDWMNKEPDLRARIMAEARRRSVKRKERAAEAATGVAPKEPE